MPGSLDKKMEECERAIKLTIDVLGRTGWPLTHFADALKISYSAANHEARGVGLGVDTLIAYLSTILGIERDRDDDDDDDDDEDGHVDYEGKGGDRGGYVFGDKSYRRRSRHHTALYALLCLVCANKIEDPEALKLCLKASKLAPSLNSSTDSSSVVKVCAEVSHCLLNTARSKDSTASSSNLLTEAAFQLFGRARLYSDAIGVLEKLKHGWTSKFKYEKFATGFLSSLWCSKSTETCKLAMNASRALFQSNPAAGLKVFTSSPAARSLNHPISPLEVCSFLKTINLSLPEMPSATVSTGAASGNSKIPALPLHSGNALAAEFLIAVSMLGEESIEEEAKISDKDEREEAKISAIHDQLCLILLEGVIGEATDDDDLSHLAVIYRRRLRQLLRWKLGKFNPESIMSYLPGSFRNEKALLLGKMGRNQEALDLLYAEMGDLKAALEFCDVQYSMQRGGRGASGNAEMDADSKSMVSVAKFPCPYLPLIEAALEKSIDDAITIMILRKDVIDQAAAVRALPPETPLASLKGFLVPALKSRASKLRQLSIAANLIRARHTELQNKKINKILMSQSSLEKVIATKGWKFGAKKSSSSPVKVQNKFQHNSDFPFHVVLTKHFFSRHVVVQAAVTNTGDRDVYDCGWTVVDTSDDCLQPSTQLPISLLPPKCSSSSFTILDQRDRISDAIVLTTELRWATGEDGGFFADEMEDLTLDLSALGSK